eukprot:COSAG02_NODE_4442_length_5352_cov_91.216638_5_plen_89_part_00
MNFGPVAESAAGQSEDADICRSPPGRYARCSLYVFLSRKISSIFSTFSTLRPNLEHFLALCAGFRSTFRSTCFSTFDPREKHNFVGPS